MLSELDRLTLSPAEYSARLLLEVTLAAGRRQTRAILRASRRAPQAVQPAPQAQPAAPTYLSLADTAIRLGLSQRSLLRLIKAGRITAKDCGTGKHRNYRIPADAVVHPKPARPRGLRRASVTRRSSTAVQPADLLPQF